MRSLVHLGNKIVAKPGSTVTVQIDGNEKLKKMHEDLHQLKKLLDADRLSEGREFLEGILNNGA